jgi:hypothetical protein
MTRESFTNGAVNLLNVIFHLSIGKATMNAPRLWKLRKGYLTEIGYGATVLFVGFSIVYEI